MSSFSERSGSGRLAGFGFVVLLHVVLIWALANGLGAKVVDVVKGPIVAKIIDTPPEVKHDEPPPPPPPALDQPPPPFVPPPEITINLPRETPPAKAIVAVQSTQAVSSARSAKVDPENPPRHPDYPPESRRMGDEGTVVLLLYLRADGTVQEARVDKSSGFSKLDRAAVREALKSWKFRPAMDAGTAVASWFHFAVTFRMTD